MARKKFTAALLGLACAFAISPNSASGAPNTTELKIRESLITRQSNSFEGLLQTWAKQHGSKAVLPLLALTRDTRLSDADRYLTLMGAARLGGPSIAPKLLPALKDRSWMIRSGALRALSALQNFSTRDAVLPLLKDASLVVRTEAVEAIRILRPEGASEALLQALENPANYHHGKAQWVPQRALQALVALNSKSSAPRLISLLNKASDPTLQAKTVEALESLTGKKLGKTNDLRMRVEAWKKELSSVSSTVSASVGRSPLPVR